MPTESISQRQYNEYFPDSKKTLALEHALDIRKFEIELYWKRAAYFWTFIGATLAGYIGTQISSADQKQDISIILSCLGFVFSIAWLCVNRGSKQWQENWENHVDLLEDDVTGPLYKVILKRSEPDGMREHINHLITGPSPISVSKINQIISLYVSALWMCLLIYSLPEFNFSSAINLFYVALVGISLIACVLFFWVGRTYGGGFRHKGTIRTAAMVMDESESNQ